MSVCETGDGMAVVRSAIDGGWADVVAPPEELSARRWWRFRVGKWILQGRLRQEHDHGRRRSRRGPAADDMRAQFLGTGI